MPQKQIAPLAELAKSLTLSMPAQRTLLVFQVSWQLFALPLDAVQEIVPMASLLRPPGIPSLLEGFLNLRGTAVPVLPLSRLFRVTEQPLELHVPLIILRGADYPIALLVDSVSQILSVGAQTLLPVQKEHSFNNCAEAEIVMADRVVHLLSIERLLIEKQRRFLNEFQAMEQKRLQDLEEPRA